jgi:hypothetical protein
MDVRPHHLRRIAAAALGLAGVCALSGCARDRYYTANPSPNGRVAFRPALDRPDVKPMYVGGYAGNDYHRSTRPQPLRVRPMEYE